MKSKALKLTFIPCTIYVNLVDDVADFRNKVLPKKYPLLGTYSKAHKSEAMYTYDDVNYFGEIWLIYRRNPRIEAVVHEACHAVDIICDTWGFEDTEFRAYLMTWIVEEVNKLL
jgi:hypothetical protein